MTFRTPAPISPTPTGEQAQDASPRTRLLEGLLLFVIWTACAYDVVGAYMSHPMSSTDGAFQTFNMVRSLAGGETPGGDVFPYLGILPVGLLIPFYVIFGQTLWASTAAAIVVVHTLFIATTWFHARLLGLRPLSRVAVVIGIYVGIRLLARVYAGIFASPYYPTPIDLILPGNSLRAIRWALPVLTGIVMYFSLRTLPVRSESGDAVDARIRRDEMASPGTPAFPLSVLWGMLAGICLLWSNDLGPITAVSIGTIWVLFAASRIPLRRLLAGLLVFGASATATAATSLMLVSGRHATDWLHFNYVGVAGDQFWFFGSHAEALRIFGLRGLVAALGPFPHSLFLIALMLLLIWLAVRLVRTRFAHPNELIMLHIGALSLAGAFVPQVGGHVEAGYTGIAIIPAVMLSGYAVSRYWRSDRTEFQATMGRWAQRLIPLSLVPGLLGLHLMNARPLLSHLRHGFPGTVAVPALGARVRESDSPVLLHFASFGRSADAAGIPRDARIMSEYQSALDIMSGSRSPSPFDAVIHALGDRARAQHTAALVRQPYPVITTINPYSREGWERIWARWNLRASWYWFSALNQRYEPYAQTPQHLIWRPRTAAAPPSRSLPCVVRRESRSRVALIFGSDEPLNAGSVDLVELRATISLDVRPSGLPLIGSRGLIRIIEPFSPDRTDDPGPAVRDLDYGYRSYGQAPIVAEHASGHAGQVILEALPSSRAALIIDRCAARSLGPSPHWRASLLPDLDAPPSVLARAIRE